MSEHQRGAWGSREDNSVTAAAAAAAASSVWWPSAAAADQQSQHQQLLAAQHQQQQLAAAVQQQQEAAARSTAAAAAAQQFLSYKMANNNFQNMISQAQTNNTITSHTINSSAGGGGGMRYDYGGGGGGGGGGGRPGDAALAANQAAQAAAAAAQWWTYPSAVAAAGLQNNPNLQNHLQNATAVNTLLNRGRMPRGRVDAKPRGRMTAYAFFVQTCREEHKKKHPDETVIFKEFSKKCAERWKTMSDKEKKRFHEMADKDKKRYDTEMQSYVPPKGEKISRKKRKQMKDPNAPKRSLSAFFWFCNDERGQVKANNPDYGVGDIAKELGRKWADAEPHVKQKYEQMAEKDKARYEREMTEYKKKSSGVPLDHQVALKESDVEDAEDDDEEDDE